MAPPTQPLNLDVEAISGICGSISIACWVVVFSPQILQNFQRGSADALSIQFIIVWLLGDIFNILGAVLQGVLPTMLILAVYYTLADLVLLAQCFYYRGFTWHDPPAQPSRTRKPVPSPGEPNERTGLLAVPSHDRDTDWASLSPVTPHIEEEGTVQPAPAMTLLQTLFWNTGAVVMVCAAGVVGWFLGQKTTGTSQDGTPASDGVLEFNIAGQIFGWLCAVAYIGSRLPQLVLNWRRKSTEGLSMLFFLFACLGNITYVLSIFAYEPKCRHDKCKQGEAAAIYGRYILVNLSWLAGSFITLLLDLGVFAQYFMYNNIEEEDMEDDEEDVVVESPQVVAPRRRNRGQGEESRRDLRPLLARGDSTF